MVPEEELLVSSSFAPSLNSYSSNISGAIHMYIWIFIKASSLHSQFKG